MTDAKTVLVLGAGIGGIVAASRLRRLLPAPHRVVVVERESTHVFSPSLPWVMTGDRDLAQISRSLSALEARGIERIHGAIERIDPAARTAQVNGKVLSGDFLIVALGAELAPESIPGLAEGGHNVYSPEGALSLRDALAAFDRGRIAVVVASMPFKCPAAPNEIAMLIEDACRRRGVRPDVTIELYTAEPGPMPIAGPVVSAALRAMIEAKAIAYHPDHALKRVDAVARSLAFANGVEAGFDLLAYVPPHRAPGVVREAGMCGESGWVPVDRGTLETKFPGVFALGDVAGILLTSVGRPLPKAGVLAHNQAEVVAHNIAHAITGRGTPGRFEGEGACFVETGDGRAGYGSGNFYAEPAPAIALWPPSRLRHWGKIAYEKYWLWSRFGMGSGS